MNHTIPNSAGSSCSQQSSSKVRTQAAGCFTLNSGRATSLSPNATGELRIAHGRVWLTFAHAAQDASVRGGDHFLDVGDLVKLLPGQQVVMEAYEKNTHEPVCFSWMPTPAARKI